VAVAPGWFWRTEYRYARYRNTTLPDTNGAGAANNSITFKPEVQTFTTGIAYKFGWLR
jgi:opacity protein-like surface antigen